MSFVQTGDCPRLAICAVAILLAAASSACRRPASASGEAAAPPRSGEVWEIDRAAGRPATAGALLAYANGLHVLVLDGDDVFAGMTPLRAEPASGGGKSLRLGGGVQATLLPTGPGRMDLRFSSGESVPMVKREVK